MVKFVAQLKENRYPNCKTFAEKLYNSAVDTTGRLACYPKTIQRDIKILKAGKRKFTGVYFARIVVFSKEIIK